MLRSKIKYAVIILFLAMDHLYGQTPEIDSLKNELRVCKDDKRKVDILYDLSKFQCLNSELPAGMKSAKMAEAISKKMNYTQGLGKAYHAIGNVYIQEENFADALEFHLKSLKIKEELNDLQGMAASYNNIGKIYNTSGNYKDAILNYKRSIEAKERLLEKAKQANNKKEIRRINISIATSSISIGTALDGSGKNEEAISYFNSALKVNEEYNNQDGIAGCYQDLGVTYMHMEKYKKGLDYFLKVYDFYKNANDERSLAGIYLNIGKAYLFLDQTEPAKQYLDKSLQLAQQLQIADVTRDNYRGLYELETNKKNYTLALIYYKRYLKCRDSISTEVATKRLARLEMNYAYQKKEKEEQLLQEKRDAISKEKSEFQNVIIISMSILLVIIIGFVVYAAINFKQKQKLNKEITLQKEIIEEKQHEIISSINYAKRIQTILLPSENYIDKELNKLIRP